MLWNFWNTFDFVHIPRRYGARNFQSIEWTHRNLYFLQHWDLNCKLSFWRNVSNLKVQDIFTVRVNVRNYSLFALALSLLKLFLGFFLLLDNSFDFNILKFSYKFVNWRIRNHGQRVSNFKKLFSWVVIFLSKVYIKKSIDNL